MKHSLNFFLIVAISLVFKINSTGFNIPVELEIPHYDSFEQWMVDGSPDYIIHLSNIVMGSNYDSGSMLESLPLDLPAPEPDRTPDPIVVEYDLELDCDAEQRRDACVDNHRDYTSQQELTRADEKNLPDLNYEYSSPPSFAGKFFNPNLANTADDAVSFFKRNIWSGDCFNSKEYFAGILRGKSPTEIFHQMAYYRYTGFREYVQTVPGFWDFIDELGPHLNRDGNPHCRAWIASSDLKFVAEKLQSLYDVSIHKKYLERQSALQKQNISQLGCQLLEARGIAADFIYQGNAAQMAQLREITFLVNELSEFRHVNKANSEALIVADESFNFTIASNNANRQTEVLLSQLCLNVAKDLLTLVNGIMTGLERNVIGLFNPQTYLGCVHLIGKIGVSLADLTEYMLDSNIAFIINDETTMIELIDRRDVKLSELQKSGKDLHQYLKNSWQEANRPRRLEIVGGLLVDGAFIVFGGKINGAILKAGSMVLGPLSKYKPAAFAKLGELGQEINKATGLACIKGKEYLRKGNQAVVAGEAGLISAEALGLTHEIETGLNVLKQESKLASVVAKSEEVGVALCHDLEFASTQTKLCDCSNVAHDLNQYERLNEALKIKEFTSIIKTTRHGVQRLIERGFAPAEVKDLIHAPDIVRTQLDNAKVFIRQLGENRYNILIYNQQKGAVITAIKKTDWDSLTNLGKTYGWTL